MCASAHPRYMKMMLPKILKTAKSWARLKTCMPTEAYIVSKSPIDPESSIHGISDS